VHTANQTEEPVTTQLRWARIGRNFHSSKTRWNFEQKKYTEFSVVININFNATNVSTHPLHLYFFSYLHRMLDSKC